MLSEHLKNMANALAITIICAIQQIIGDETINMADSENTPMIWEPYADDCSETVRILWVNKTEVQLDNNDDPIEWNEIANINELLFILEWLEDWRDTQVKEARQRAKETLIITC